MCLWVAAMQHHDEFFGILRGRNSRRGGGLISHHCISCIELSYTDGVGKSTPLVYMPFVHWIALGNILRDVTAYGLQHRC